MLRFLLIFVLGISFFPFSIKADGILIPSEIYRIQETGQRAVIFYEKGKEALIISASFKGNAKDFGWIIPVPKKPEVSKASDEIFASLQEITSKYRKYPSGHPPFLSDTKSVGESVTVIETQKIDYYEISVLSAGDSQALTQWLLGHGYKYPEESAYVLNDYINNNWYFVAIKISPEAQGADEVVRDLKEGHTNSLKIEFDSDAIIYPLKISGIDISQGLVKISDNLILNPQRAENLRNIGYQELTDKEGGAQIISQIVQDIFSKKIYPESQAAKYPLIIAEKDYSQANCFNVADCQRVVENWFNNYFSRQGLYFYPQSNYVPIYLYVIADSKKEIPGFNTEYANWISAKDIRKLGYDTNGRPLINPQGNKYYLTYLYKSMPVSDMTSDLIIRDAENNRRVNAPNPWLNFLFGSLIALGTVFVWLFSPFGIIFVGASSIRFMLKSDAARLFGRVFQVLTLFITLILFIFFLVLALAFSSTSAEYMWAFGLAIGFSCLSVGQIIVIKKI